jgi:hypothetical protein
MSTYFSDSNSANDSYFDAKKVEFIDDLSCAALPGSLYPQGVSAERATDRGPDEVLLRRTAGLWVGLCRVYFGEVEDDPDLDDLLFPEPSAKSRSGARQSVAKFKRDIQEWIRQELSQVHDDLNAAPPSLPFRPADDDDADDSALPPPLALPVPEIPNDDDDVSAPPASGGQSAGENASSRSNCAVSWLHGKPCSSLGFLFRRTIERQMLLLRPLIRWKAGLTLNG